MTATIPLADTRHKWFVLLAIGVGSFMSALDGSVANTVLPLISTAFGSSVAQIEWVVTVYLLVVSSLLLTFGRLGDMRGQKTVYLTGFALFTIGSGLCALSASAGALIAARGFQALGAAMLFASAPAILTKTFAASERGRALGLQAMMTYLGLTVGPSLGGWLAGRFGWQAVFTINLPVGALGFVLSARSILPDPPRDRFERFDLPGAVIFLTGLISLLLALNLGYALGWASPALLGLLAAAATLLAAFVVVERRASQPMLDLSLFGRRLFSASAASAFLNYTCLYSIVFLMPFYLIQGRGLTPAEAGLVLTAQPLVMAVAAPLSGSLSDRIGSRLLSSLGMLILGMGLILMAGLQPTTPLLAVELRLSVVGLGTGIFISPNTSALMGAAPRAQQGIASGVLATARNVGMVTGVGIAGAVFTTVLARAGAEDGVYSGVRLAFLVAGGVALLGALVSTSRGQATPVS
jgi:EmrB/QacA subfamily drug resistance transporter